MTCTCPSCATTAPSPVLDCGLAYFDCTLETVHVAGDHDVCVGRVRAFAAMGTGAPLVFAGGAYLSISGRSASSYR
ncbi:flavin reductase family protein [Dactylosporangium cerinum]|uniref:Flavin reductase family protein n=1 Tax=Dactylosporangium cerinum TaxID=1434730 RepID=A0ABV9W8L7_9ACTN